MKNRWVGLILFVAGIALWGLEIFIIHRSSIGLFIAGTGLGLIIGGNS